MNKLFTLLFVIVLTVSSSNTLKAQSDCCGLGSIFQSLVQSGIYGGYGIQLYSAQGLNDVLPADAGFKDFKTTFGWRVGANILGFRHENILFAMKFHYQSMTEKQDRTGEDNGGSFTQELDLKLNQLAFGLSFSYILGKNFDLRLFDGMLTWNGAKLTNSFQSSNPPEDDVYESPESSIGFTFNTGIVWYPFPPYLAIGILGGYSIFSIDELKLEKGNSSLTSIREPIDGGGLFAMAVLTVGIPFN
jgi:hypothetical protein